MKVFILLSVVVVALASRECGDNQHYEQCGTACPLTCENYRNPPKICVMMCVSGCFCDEDYVKTADGRCVRPEQCSSSAQELTPKECGVNERYSTCGSACPLTCDNYDNPPKICPLMCMIGCECEEGFVKTRDGRCIKPEDCPNRQALNPKECGVNERYSTCGTACPLTCDNYDNPPKACPLMCMIGCECEKGFVKTRDGRCIKPEDCPNRQAAGQKSCLGDPDPGMCKAYMPMWYYDVKTEKCHKFIYGGCQGNGNRYATEQECLDHCDGVYNEATQNQCDLPPEVGPCRGFFRRFYFDRDANRCRSFGYGGCKGNANNFVTFEECEHTCL